MEFTNTETCCITEEILDTARNFIKKATVLLQENGFIIAPGKFETLVDLSYIKSEWSVAPTIVSTGEVSYIFDYLFVDKESNEQQKPNEDTFFVARQIIFKADDIIKTSWITYYFPDNEYSRTNTNLVDCIIEIMTVWNKNFEEEKK